MTVMPEGAAPDGILATILLSLGKLETGLAVADTKLDSLLTSHGDHEQRIRSLEQTRAEDKGGRDVWARILAGAAAAAAIGSTVANYLHK